MKLSHPKMLVQRAKKASVTYLLLSISSALMSVVLLVFLGAPVVVVVAVLIVSRLLFMKHKRAEISVERAKSGAQGEDQVGEILKMLPQGWEVDKNVPLPSLGDADFFIRSPLNLAFVLEVKSHGGKVSFDGSELIRESRGKSEPFEKDFISQALRQSSALRDKFGMNVIPVLVFTRARLVCSEKKVAEVHLVEGGELLTFLSSFG